MRRAAALALFVLSAGCGGRYADFTLPPPEGAPRDVRWQWSARPDPVLARGSSGKWDSVDALNPSVVQRNGEYLMVHSGYDGRTWHTLAGGRLVLSPDSKTWEGDYIAANGSALLDGGALLYWYQAGGRTPRLGFARDWRKHPEPVVPLGPRGSWDERAVADPYVIRAGGRLYMMYLGQDRAGRQRLGLAVSTDGIAWEKLRANPVLDIGPEAAFDENGLGEPALWQSHGWWWMLYTGRDRHEVRRLGLAKSRDGVRWERVPDFVISGDRPWNDKVMCDPHVIANGDTVRVWFGGGNVARPDENINGQIGYGELTAH